MVHVMTSPMTNHDDLLSPLARLLSRVAARIERRHRARAEILWLNEIPPDLRRDVGLGGGAVHTRGFRGRTFIMDDLPDRTLSGWNW